MYFGHPAATRAYVVQAAREMEQGQGREGQERSADVNATKADVTNSLHPSTPSINPIPDPMSPPNPTHSHATSGALNMRGLMLHVFGDALGNVGVIVSGLIIWFAKGDWRFYMDPVASLIITMIIAWNTVPLSECFFSFLTSDSFYLSFLFYFYSTVGFIYIVAMCPARNLFARGWRRDQGCTWRRGRSRVAYLAVERE